MTDYQRIEKVIQFVGRSYRNQPSLSELARVAGVSESHFHRMFSRWAGVTPKAFLKLITASHARALLQESRDLLNVSLETGLSGPGRLHDLMVTVEGLSPGEVKSGGGGVKIRFGFGASPLGKVLIAASKRGVCHLAFVEGGNEKQALIELKEKWPNAEFKEDKATASRLASAVFSKRKRMRVALQGTPFQLKVWQALLNIPPGHVLTYRDIAQSIGRPNSARAVGTAVAQNTVGFLIPCHRVIRETGVIGEYRWGTDRKKALLAWEHCCKP